MVVWIFLFVHVARISLRRPNHLNWDLPKKKTRLKCCTIGDMKMAETIDQNTKSEVIFLRQASLIVVDGDVVYSVHTLMSHNPDNILFYEHGMWLLVSLLCHCNGPHSACTSSRFVILLRHPLVFTHGWWCL